MIVPTGSTRAVFISASSGPIPAAFFLPNHSPRLPIHLLSSSAIPHHSATSFFRSAAPAVLVFRVANGPSSYYLGTDGGVADLVPAGGGVITRPLLSTTPHVLVSRTRREHSIRTLLQRFLTLNQMNHPPYHLSNLPSRIFQSPLLAGAVSRLTYSIIPYHYLLFRHHSSLSTPVHAAAVGVSSPKASTPQPNRSSYLGFEQRQAARLRSQLV